MGYYPTCIAALDLNRGEVPCDFMLSVPVAMIRKLCPAVVIKDMPTPGR